MDKQKLKEQVETIRQAFGYINRFKNETFVIKIESSLISHPFFPILIKDIALLHHIGIRIVLVPGAKVRIDEVLVKRRNRLRNRRQCAHFPRRIHTFYKNGGVRRFK